MGKEPSRATLGASDYHGQLNPKTETQRVSRSQENPKERSNGDKNKSNIF
jgi:hypothetical protein